MEKERDRGMGKHNQEIKRMMVHNPQIFSAVLLNSVIFAANISWDFLDLFTHQFPFPISQLEVRFFHLQWKTCN